MLSEVDLLGGSRVACSDGAWGVLGWIALDSASLCVTQLAIEGHVLRSYGQLVPAQNLRETIDGVLLACSLADLDRCPSAEALAPYAGGAVPIAQIPTGLVQLSADTRVDGPDGDLGELLGIAVSIADLRLTRPYLSIGHLGHKRRVSIPAEFIQSVTSREIRVALQRGQLTPA